MNRKRIRVYFVSVRRSHDFVIYFVRFVPYIMHANIHEFYNVDILLNLRRSNSDLHKLYIILN